MPVLSASGLTGQLRDGATLVLDAVDEMYEPIAAVAETLERELRDSVQVNAYAGWKTSKGFDVHWDDHDVIVLQVAGRKHWQIFGTTREHPLYRDIESAPKPTTPPVWDQIIKAGDFLYVPRGWWHVATPLAEASLHLTFGINNRTGLDVLNWLGERLRSVTAYRADVPKFSGEEGQQSYSEELKAALNDLWTEGLIAEFLEDTDAKARVSIRMNLPWSVEESGLPPNDRFRVRFNGRRPAELRLSGDKSSVEFKFAGKRWRFASAATCVLKPILAHSRPTLRRLISECQATLTEEELRALLVRLGLDGVVSFELDEDDGQTSKL